MTSFSSDIVKADVSVFQRLYDSEINFTISTLWDGGFDVALGDEMNGFRAATNFYDWEEIGPWLDKVAREHFPESWYATGRRPQSDVEREE